MSFLCLLFSPFLFDVYCCYNDPGFDKNKIDDVENTSSYFLVFFLSVLIFRSSFDALNFLFLLIRSPICGLHLLSPSHSIVHLMHDDFYVAIYFHSYVAVVASESQKKLLIIHNSYFLLFCAQFSSLFRLFLFLFLSLIEYIGHEKYHNLNLIFFVYSAFLFKVVDFFCICLTFLLLISTKFPLTFSFFYIFFLSFLFILSRIVTRWADEE